MAVLIKTLAAVAVGTMLATNAFAQSAWEIRGASPLNAIENEPAPKLIADPPLPDQLARGVVEIQYRVENLHIVPVFGAGALNVSPRVGHLHVTVDDLPWHWTDASDINTIAVVGLPSDRVGRPYASSLHRLRVRRDGHVYSACRDDESRRGSQLGDRLRGFHHGWCHPRGHCSDADAADADHQDSGRPHLRPWHGHVPGSAHFADRDSRDRAQCPLWHLADIPVVFGAVRFQG